MAFKLSIVFSPCISAQINTKLRGHLIHTHSFPTGTMPEAEVSSPPDPVLHWRQHRGLWMNFYLQSVLTVTSLNTRTDFKTGPGLLCFGRMHRAYGIKNIFAWSFKKNPLHTSWLQNQHSTAYALSGKQEKNLCTLKESQREGETFLLWSNRGKKTWFMNCSVKSGL